MARSYLAAIGLTSLVVLTLAWCAPGASAARAGADKPSIAITNLHNGTTVTGSNITVDVHVANFKLVPPIYVNPPKLSGAQGHIHYVLDSLANFVARRDATVSLSHTWTGIAPGKHKVMAYLATSQHGRFPGVPQAEVTITVAAHSSHPSSGKHPSSGGTTPPPSTMPKTGGGMEVGAGSGSSQLLALGTATSVLGAVLLIAARRRSRFD